MRVAILLVSCSLLIGCGIERPDSELCLINLKENHKLCYNLKSDYDDLGNLRPDAKPKVKPPDVDKNVCADPVSFANIKAYIAKLREIGKSPPKDQ